MIEIIPFDARYSAQMLEIARQIHAESIYFDVPLDEGKLIAQLAAASSTLDTLYFRLAVWRPTDEVLGAFYGAIFPTFFGDCLMIADKGQWTRRDGTQRNAHELLLADFEAWGRAKGAKKAGLGYNIRQVESIEKLRRLAQMRGYRVTGYNLMKDL